MVQQVTLLGLLSMRVCSMLGKMDTEMGSQLMEIATHQIILVSMRPVAQVYTLVMTILSVHYHYRVHI